MPPAALDQDAWLAGFTDGEGSFVITATGSPKGNRQPALAPRFTLGLHAADGAILHELRDTFGGSLSFSERNPDRPSSDRWTWTVVAKADLRRLVAYFDRFPLRARKARDYATWRAAVEVYLAAPSAPACVGEMRSFRAVLQSGRVWVTSAAVEAAGSAHGAADTMADVVGEG